MKRLLGFALALTICTVTAYGAESTDPLLAYFQDDATISIERDAFEPQPVAVRLFDDSPEAMNALLQPPAIDRFFLRESGRAAGAGDFGFETISVASPSIPTSVQAAGRAATFARDGFLELAKDQYAYALTLDPANKNARKALEELVATEQQRMIDAKTRTSVRELAQKDLRDGIAYFERNQIDQAVAAFVRVLNVDPTNEEAVTYIKRIGAREN